MGEVKFGLTRRQLNTIRKAEPTLRDLGMQDDIIRAHTAHSTGGRQLRDRHRRVVATGLHDELAGEAYAVIDSTDGRAHHVRFRGIEAFAHVPSGRAGGL
jgi:type IV secretory pathway VirD2 relaxase